MCWIYAGFRTKSERIYNRQIQLFATSSVFINVREIFLSGNKMKFLVGPALNSRNYQRRFCNRPSVYVICNKMVSGGYRTRAAEDGSGKGVQGNEAL